MELKYICRECEPCCLLTVMTDNDSSTEYPKLCPLGRWSGKANWKRTDDMHSGVSDVELRVDTLERELCVLKGLVKAQEG